MLYQRKTKFLPHRLFKDLSDFHSYFVRTDGTTEYAKISGNRINLPIDIFVDDSSNYKLRHHILWMYVQDSNGFFPISISLNPKCLINDYCSTISDKTLEIIYSFIKTNINILYAIADEKIDAADFVEIINK